MGMPAGRPRIYNSPDEMQEQIDAYFIQPGVIPTVPGLAYFLGFANKHSLIDYAEKEEYSFTVSRAKSRIELVRAETLVHPDLKNCNGIKFDLQNNFGWKDKTETEHSGGMQITRIELPPKAAIGDPVDL